MKVNKNKKTLNRDHLNEKVSVGVETCHSLKKGEIISLKIEDMSAEGKGIGKYEGLVVFVSGAVYGDYVKAEITKLKKKFALAKTVQIIEPSPYRKQNPCRHISECGGCSYGLLEYDIQVKLKENQVRNCLDKIAGIPNARVNPMIKMDEPYEYRNKAVLGVSTKEGRHIPWTGRKPKLPTAKSLGKISGTVETQIGFYRDKSNDLVNIECCNIQSPVHEAVIGTLRNFMDEKKMEAYDERRKKGLIRNITIRSAVGTGQVMVVLSVNGKEVPHIDELISHLEEAVYDVPIYDDGPFKDVEFYLASLVLNIFSPNDKGKYGEKNIQVFGSNRIKEEIGGLKFEISPTAFYQVNPVQMVKLYDKALEYADIQDGDSVLDLYCGVGSIGLYMAKSKDCNVIGIESSKDAVLDANRNAIINHVTNIRFFQGKAEDVLPFLMGDKMLYKPNEINEMQERQREIEIDKVDVAVVDPPRAGLHEELINAVVKANPRRIVYISCDIGTLARDIKIFCEKGYAFKEATPVDMFPDTGHVECIALIQRAKS